jgi:hypothetical protein
MGNPIRLDKLSAFVNNRRSATKANFNQSEKETIILACLKGHPKFIVIAIKPAAGSLSHVVSH